MQSRNLDKVIVGQRITFDHICAGQKIDYFGQGGTLEIMDKQSLYHVSYSQTRYVSFEKVTRNRIHRHSFYEPCIVISGTGEFEHDSHIFALHEGDLFIADPGIYHEIRSLKSRDLKLYFFTLNITKTREPTRTNRRTQLSQRSLADFLLNHRVHLPSQSHLVPLFEHAMKVARRGTNYQQDGFYHEASLLLLHQIVSALTDSALLSEEDYSDHIQKNKIVEFIENQLHQPLRVTELAQACGMSERTLRRKWRNWSARTLTDEINQRRMERACYLLLLPDISIADVGYQVGIWNPAQFSRIFKKIKGSSPKVYRQRYLDKIPSGLSGQLPFQTEFLDGDNTERYS